MPTFQKLEEIFRSYSPHGELELIRQAYALAEESHKGQTRASGEPYINHPLSVAINVAELRLDDISIAAALLHDVVEDTHTSLEEIQQRFGKDVAVLVDGVTKLTHLKFNSREQMQAENFRRMMLAMSKDIRVILVKLADRLHNMRTLGFKAGQSAERIARETMDIYAPLANRLGLYDMKSQLEDLSFRYLEPELFLDIEEKMSRVRKDQELYIQQVKTAILAELASEGVEADVTGRTKHIYSVVRKMRAQKIDFEQVFDLVAFRALVGNVNECWRVLGVIHQLWKPIPGRFKDYIHLPKPNGYRSLHTAVMGPNGEPMEIQVRTWQMHEVAERGIAAHWNYKENGKFSASSQEKVRMLQELLNGIRSLSKDTGDAREFMASMKEDLFGDEVFVFTPKADVRVFPRGATPVDFAYAVHSEVGFHCIGARINGVQVPLSYPLHNGDQVQIITSPNQTPSEDWLQFVHTGSARSKIKAFLRRERRKKSLEVGQAILEKAFRKKKLSLKSAMKKGDLLKAVETFGTQSEEELLVRVGNGRIEARDVLRAIIPDLDEQSQELEANQNLLTEMLNKLAPGKAPGTVLVGGEGDIVTHFAHCCSPLPGDRIVGFVNRARGISVHRQQCPSMANVPKERLVDVQWDKKTGGQRLVKIKVMCMDTAGMLAAMTSIFTRMGVNIVSANCQGNRDKGATNIFEILVEDAEHLKRLSSALENTSGILSVERI